MRNTHTPPTRTVWILKRLLSIALALSQRALAKLGQSLGQLPTGASSALTMAFSGGRLDVRAGVIARRGTYGAPRHRRETLPRLSRLQVASVLMPHRSPAH